MKTVVLLAVSLLCFVAPAPVNGAVFWLVFCYLVVRAWPHVKADLDRLPGFGRLRPRRTGRYSAEREGAL